MTPWQPPVRRVEWLLDMSPAGAGAGLHMSHMLKSAITHHEDPLVAYPGLLEAPLDIEWAEMFASQHALPDGVLNLLVDALNTTPTLALFISMTRHRDMTDMTHLHLQHAGERAFKDAQGSARLLASRNVFTQDQLLAMIGATRGQLRRVLTDAYFTAHFNPAAILAQSADEYQRKDLIARVLAGSAVDGPLATAIVDQLAGGIRATSLRRDAFTLRTAAAVPILATRSALPLLRTMLAKPAKIPVDKADAEAILAITDALVRRKLLNLTNLAEFADDATLGELAGHAAGIHPDAAQILLANHSQRLGTTALTAMLDHLDERSFQGFLSAERTDHAYDAVKASRHWGPTPIVDWMANNKVADGASHPLVLKLAAQQLEVSAHAAPGVANSLMELDVQTYLRGRLRNAFGDDTKAWELATQLSASRKVGTLDELIAVVGALSSAAS